MILKSLLILPFLISSLNAAENWRALTGFLTSLKAPTTLSSDPTKTSKASRQEEPKFVGDWTDTIDTITGLGSVIHTPKYVQFGDMYATKCIYVPKGMKLDGHRLTGALILKTNATRDDVIIALMTAGIYKE